MRNPNRYATILRLRQQTEDLRAQDLAASRRAVQQSERERTSLELTRQLALEHAGEMLGQSFDAADIRQYYQYERHLMTLRDEKDAEVRELKRVEEEKRVILEEATLSRRVAEKLHEKRHQAYHAYLERESQKQLDEVATLYAARDRQRGSQR